MSTRQITAALAALVLGAGVAGACGGGGGRENLDQGNPGELESQGGQETQPAPGPTTLGSTGEEQPEVTQPEGGG